MGINFPSPCLLHRGSGREVSGGNTGSVLMNSFQAACCRSHLLLRPGVGKRARDVFVRVTVRRGEETRRRAAGRQASEFSHHPGAPRTHPPVLPPGPDRWAVALWPDSWLKKWSGIKTSPGVGVLGVTARERARTRKKSFKESGR